jgi:pentatricopeptide repeat protein
MNRLGVEPDVFTFNIIITILAHSNHVNEALSYLRLMTSVYSLAPTGPTISIISRMLGAANMPDVADNIYKQLSHVQLSDASRESVVLSHLIRQPSSKLAQQLTSVILDSGSPVSQHFITTAITHIIRACGLEEGMDFAGWLEKSNLPTYNTHFVGVVLDALTKRRDYGSVIEVFNEWIVKGLPLDRLGTPLPLFLNACGALRRPGSAIRGWKKFRKAYPNFLIQDESYVALMVALGRGRKIGPALRVVADFLNARRKLGVTHVRLKIAQRLLHELFFARYMDIEELDRECKMVNSYAREQGNFLWVPLPVVERTLLVGRHLIAGHASMESIRSRPPLDIRELTMELLQLNTANTTALRTARSIADAQWVAEKAKKKKTEIASTPSTTEPPG